MGEHFDIITRLKSFSTAWRSDGETPLNYALDEAAAEIERLRALLRHADDVVIWEHTHARAGFQEEIEAALGIGAANEQPAAGPPRLIQGALDLGAENARLRAALREVIAKDRTGFSRAALAHVARKALADEQSPSATRNLGRLSDPEDAQEVGT